jgi:hypothetical protein
VATLENKIYAALYPMPSAYTIESITIAWVAGSANVNAQLYRTPLAGSQAAFGSPVTGLSSASYQTFAVSLAGSAGDVIQVGFGPVGVTAPTNVTVSVGYRV